MWLAVAASIPAAFGLVRWGVELVAGPRKDDFRDYFVAAWLGRQSGWASLYDIAQQQRAARTLGLDAGWLPYFNPPPLAWLVAPLTYLPFQAGYAAWTGLMAVALVTAWLAIAPRSTPWTGAAHLLVALGLYAVTFSLALGQVVPLLAAAVAVAARFLAGRGAVAAGLVLVVIDLKPQVAFLVPLALLVSGRWVTFVAWLLPTIALAGASLLVLGESGFSAYANALLHASALDQPSLRLDALLPLPRPFGYAASAVAAAVALVVAFRLRALPGAALAAGILGSLLAAPHLNLQDLTLLVVAAWALWPAGLALTRWRWLAAGWLAVELGAGTGIPALIFEVAALARLAREAIRSR